MQPISFEPYRSTYPDLEGAFRRLNEFIGDNPRLNHVELRRLCKYQSTFHPTQMRQVLDLLTGAGVLKQIWAVEAATTRTLAPGFYEHQEDIPEVVHDALETRFFRDDSDIIPVWVASADWKAHE
jgi:hypothetical protein